MNDLCPEAYQGIQIYGSFGCAWSRARLFQLHLMTYRFFSCLLVLFIAACTSDELPEPDPSACVGDAPTYEIDIRPIVEETCAYSGCHLGGAPGVYNTYENVAVDVANGLFRERVIDLREDPLIGMPPNNAPDDRPTDLTAEQLMLIDCWIQAGHPE